MSSKALQELIRGNALEKIGADRFCGHARHSSSDRIYGGQILAQAISAGRQTVSEEFDLHSVHAYFWRAGNPSIPIVYDVDLVRDGRSFAGRSVRARQNDVDILSCSMSFQIEEEGIEHQVEKPVTPGPEKLVSEASVYKRALPEFKFDWPIEFRQVEKVDLLKPEVTEPKSYIWLRAVESVEGDLGIHQQLLAYASDQAILSTVLRPHGVSHLTPGVETASLDHAIWFHRPFRIDDWLLYELDSDSAFGGRGVARGRIYDNRGRLVASVCQEGMVRHKTPNNLE